MTLNKRITRTFMEHKGFYIGMFLLIFMSTALFLAFNTSMTSIKKSVEQNRLDCRMEDADFTYSRLLDADEIRSFEQAYDLDIQESIYKDMYLAEGATLRIRPVYDEINLYSVYEGRALAKRGDILVDRFFLDAQNLRIGDTVTLADKEFTVCGVVAYPDYIATIKSAGQLVISGKDFGIAVVSGSDYRSFTAAERMNYSVKFASGNEDAFRFALADAGTVVNWTDAENNIRISGFDGEIDALIVMSSVAPFFILLVSCLIMAVIMGRMLRKEYAYIGTLSALGYKKKELLAHYLLLPCVISLMGSLCGLIGGYFLTEPMEGISKVEYGVPAVTLFFPARTLLAAIFLPLLLMVLAAAFSVLRALKINTAILLKASAGKQKTGFLTRLIPHRAGPFRLRFICKEMLTSIPRSLLMMLGVCVASLFILSGFIINGSVKNVMETGMKDVYKYKYQYTLNVPQTGASQIDVPDEAETFMLAAFDYETAEKTYGVTIMGIHKSTEYVTLTDLDGNAAASGKTIVSESVARRLMISPGDTITLRNRSDRKNYYVRIDAVADVNIGENIFMDINQLNMMMSYPEGTYIGIYSNKALDLDKSMLLNTTTDKEIQSALEKFVETFRIFLYILSLVAAVIGVIVIYTVTTLLISENSKNISMLQVMGYKKTEISGLLLRANTFLVWAGFLLAIPVSQQIMKVFFAELTSNMYFAFDALLSVTDIAFGLAFILCIYYLTLFFARKKAYAIRLSDSLKSRE